MTDTKIALGTWVWGSGALGGDAVYGVNTNEENLKPVFEAAAKAGLGLWDTATVYAMGDSERILGKFIASVPRESVQISTKFTPQLAEMYDNSVEKMAEASMGGRKYNPILQELEKLTDTLTSIGKRHGLTCSQTAVAWAVTKSVKPIVGATKPYHVTEAAEAASVTLTQDEIAELDRLADAAGIDARGGWEGRA